MSFFAPAQNSSKLLSCHWRLCVTCHAQRGAASRRRHAEFHVKGEVLVLVVESE